MFRCASTVAVSRGSAAASTLSTTAASATLRVIGPAVSCEGEIGMMPLRLPRPTVGLGPTSPATLLGHMIEPSVSVPMPACARLAATAAPVPELEPHGLRPAPYGFTVCPPRALQPLDERFDRMLAHSDRLVLPTSTAPA